MHWFFNHDLLVAFLTERKGSKVDLDLKTSLGFLKAAFQMND